MFLRYAIRGIMDRVKNQTMLNFLNLPDEDNQPTDYYYFYDPLLTFEPRLQKRLSYLDYEDRGDSFICAMWSRTSLETLSEQPRQFQAQSVSPELGIGDKFQVKNVKCQVSIVFVSNDPEYLTTFEELLVMDYDRRLTLQMDFPIPVNILELGSITSVNTSSKYFVVPEVLDKELTKLGSKLKIFSSTGNDGEYTLTQLVVDQVNHTSTLYVSEPIPSNIADGIITQKNGLMITQGTVHYSDITVSDINKLDTTSRGELTFLQVNISIQYPVVRNTTYDDNYGGDSNKIIKHIHLKEKAIHDPRSMTSEDMVLPYTETIIE